MASKPFYECFVVVSMATLDSGDSNLPNESGNEVCDILNWVAIYYEKGTSGNAFLRKEKFLAQVSRKLRSLKALKETVKYVFFFFKEREEELIWNIISRGIIYIVLVSNSLPVDSAWDLQRRFSVNIYFNKLIINAKTSFQSE